MTKSLFRYCLLALCAAAFLLVILGRYTDVDLWLADQMYDFATGKFPWRENWFAAVLMHRWMKPVFIALGMVPFAILMIDRTLPCKLPGAESRAKLWGIALSFVLVTLAVTLLKRVSIHACPWDVQRYGGSLPHLKIFDALPSGILPGHCFPAGHASVALWIPSLAIWWLPQNRKVAGIVFAAGLLPGLILGWVQQLRGAHFLTHTLWSAWIGALVIVCIARALHPFIELPEIKGDTVL